MTHYDDLETRSDDERAADLARALPEQIARAQRLPGYAEALAGVDPASVTSKEALAALPVLRKSDLHAAQAERGIGAYLAKPPSAFAHLFQSPGPIYEPGETARDWWRVGRFLHAAGVGPGDIVQNCFAYHLTPAGHIFESGARAVGAAVIPPAPARPTSRRAPPTTSAPPPTPARRTTSRRSSTGPTRWA